MKKKKGAARPATRVDDIAIVGMACMFSQAPDASAFWNNILGKVEAIGQPLPAWGAGRYLDPEDTEGERLYTTAGGFLGDLYRFDPKSFGIMPGSVDGQEPDQFIALKVARDALADAGYIDRPFDRTRTGVILGHSTYLNRAQANAVQFGVVLDQTIELVKGLHPELGDEQQTRLRKVLKRKLAPFTADTGPGQVPNVMTGRIANRLDLQGPNYIIDAACASSHLAVQAGIEELRAGRSEMMLVGGVNASTPAEAFLTFCQIGALSRTSRIRPFDAGADGTLLGEGAGVLVLKRLADARRDGDRVYAVVKAVGQSSDGRGAGLLAPRREGEILALQRSYDQAGVEPASVTLLEAHGTGIPLGDRTEIDALKHVFGERTTGPATCAIGSVKSMICHCIPAAGIAGIIKASLSLYHKILPPTLCEEVNPELEIDATPFYVNTEARPWIHSQSRPRRAGVNAFGFGGVNAHAILEEAPAPDGDAPVRLSAWPTELLVFAASDRAALIADVEKVATFIASRGDTDVSLTDLAFTLTGRLGNGDQRLAVLAASLEDAAEKLHRTRGMLEDPDRGRIQTRTGVFFTDQPLDGKVALMFPGEGAQYPNMLAGVAMHFPVVRSWFDLWDTIFESERVVPPSAVVFQAPTGLDPAEREHLDSLLYGLELGSESVFITSQALFALLQAVGLQADAIVGHSSGENSALVAAGAVDFGGSEHLREHIRRLNVMYQKMEAAGDVATGTLLTVGAVERDRILEVIGQSGGRLHLALDNCRHQSVLFGADEDIEAAADIFRREGGLCSRLPFDRAYHTPLFAPVAQLVDSFYERVAFRAPSVPVYSCKSAEIFPEQEQAIKRLTVEQWQSCVRFTETIEKMYDDGVRIFVEVGPASNLTGFVDDILRGRDYLAVPTDNRNRPGLVQFQTALARMFVHGRPLELSFLYEGRLARALDIDSPPVAPARPPLLANTLPYIRLDRPELEELRAMLHQPVAVPVPDTALPAPAGSGACEAREPSGPGFEPGEEPAGAGTVMAGFLATMQEFLAGQQRVMASAFGAVPAMAEGAELPLIHYVAAQDETHVEIECDFDLAQTFLRHHVLYATEVSEFDPDLTALPVVPLTVSLELLAETAFWITDRPVLAAFENVRAYNWVAVDEGAKTVRAVGRLLAQDASETRVHAAVYEGEQLLLEGEAVFADTLPAVAEGIPPLRSPRPPVWQEHELYTRGMFHGPLFHSVRRVREWGDEGIDVDLADTPTLGFFRPGHQPHFLLNPVLLDAVGHISAFWVAQRWGTDFSSFPSRIARIVFYDPAAENTEGAVLRGRLGFVAADGESSRFLEGNYECVDAAGAPLFRIEGWRDRFFNVPHRFYLARTQPREAWLGEDWSERFPEIVPGTAMVWYMPSFAPGFLDDAGGVWRRLLVHTFLSREERDTWFALRMPPRSLNEWLMGRIAVKEAVRRSVFDRSGVLLYPADVVIRNEEGGRPYVAAEGLEALGPVPEISVSHLEGAAIAAVGNAERPVGIDFEVLGRVRPEEVMTAALTPFEQSWFTAGGANGDEAVREELLLRIWCAKEATSKCLGVGFAKGPQRFEMIEISESRDRALVRYGDHTIPILIRRDDDIIIALANVA